MTTIGWMLVAVSISFCLPQNAWAEEKPDGSTDSDDGGFQPPTGREGFFPAGFTQPKMATGGGGVAIVGPTPFFKKQTTGSGANAKVSRTGSPNNPIPKTNGNTDLMVAAVNGDLAEVSRLLNELVSAYLTCFK
ncbi:MAG: hypothetical protein V1724_04555 [Chloroflexota bacterium]